MCLFSWGLLVLCGLFWFYRNPLEAGANRTGKIRQVSDSYDTSVGEALINDSKEAGLLIFVAGPGAIFFMWVLGGHGRWWDLHFYTSPDNQAPCFTEERLEKPTASEEHQRSIRAVIYLAVAFFESTLLMSLVATTMWRDYWHAVKVKSGAETSLLGMGAKSIDGFFVIQILLGWLQPWLIAMHVVSPTVLCVVFMRIARWPEHLSLTMQNKAMNVIRPYTGVIIMVHVFLSMALGAIIFRSGIVPMLFLSIVIASNAINLMVFVYLLNIPHPKDEWRQPNKAEYRDVYLSSSVFLFTLQITGTTVLVFLMGNGSQGLFPFLFTVEITFFFLALMGSALFMSVMELDMGRDDNGSWAENNPAPHIESHYAIIHEPLLSPLHVEEEPQEELQFSDEPYPFFNCAAEVLEARDREKYGARIKGRRACLALGAVCLVVGAVKDIHLLQGDTTTMAWDSLERELHEYAGPDYEITPSNSSFLEPIVATYGQVIHRSTSCKMAYASLFALSMAADLYKSDWWWLKASRLLGFAGTFVAILSLFYGFTPDYVNALDFQHTLQRCGTEFCAAVSSSARATFSTAMVAQAGVTFVPILINMPWTLGRVAFFLAVDKKNDPSIVRALLWGAVSSMFRLTLLPITVVYLYHPIDRIIPWYIFFLGSASLVLAGITFSSRCFNCESESPILRYMNKQNLLWYAVWGWGAFLIPLLVVVSVALEESIGQLIQNLWNALFSSEEWQNTIAEFVLSDVVISDLFYVAIADEKEDTREEDAVRDSCKMEEAALKSAPNPIAV